ncbi:hypothetical protein LOC67_15225 [Stieleria sp. JC731]|uniref:hypothetical protein n=1 Tax=Pirellulaceae TaxID=2691357 RepID=UPI001E5CAAD4|nr:hypothetical protein [Stieleria sp. JC731]MCC9601911.1 hypothetical protein [Stieleria sp. JC731]
MDDPENQAGELLQQPSSRALRDQPLFDLLISTSIATCRNSQLTEAEEVRLNKTSQLPLDSTAIT